MALWSRSLTALPEARGYFHNPHDGSQLSVTPVSGDQCVLLASVGTTHTHGVQTHMQGETPKHMK